MSDKKELQQIIDDLLLVKTAISKSSSILRFVAFSRTVSLICLFSGLTISVLAGVIYLTIQHYGSYGAIPPGLTMVFYLAAFLIFVAIAVVKVNSFTNQVRKAGLEITFGNLLRKIYTPQTTNIILGLYVTMLMVIVFLVTQGHYSYIVPSLAILIGLASVNFVNLFFIRELMVTGNWLLATGIITLFTAQTLHPLLALIITFGLGLSSTYAAHRLMKQR